MKEQSLQLLFLGGQKYERAEQSGHGNVFRIIINDVWTNDLVFKLE